MEYVCPEPHCQPIRPLAFSPPETLISTLLCPVPSRHPDVRPMECKGVHPDHFHEQHLARRRAVQCDDAKMSYDDATLLIRRWFTDFDSFHGFVGNPVVLTRLLTVLHALGSPEPLQGDYLFERDVRCHPRVVPVPGGNLDMLIWLAWRYMHAFAFEGVALVDKLEAESDSLAAATLLFKLVTPAGTVPGHDFPRAINRSVPEAAIALWPGPVSAMRPSMISAVRLLGRGVRTGRVDHPSGQRMRGALYSYVKPVGVDERTWNYLAYCRAARDVLQAVVELLRLVGHIVALGRRMVCPLTPYIGMDYGTPGLCPAAPLAEDWGVCATLLREVLKLDATLLDGHFIDSAAPTGVENWFWAVNERACGEWFNEYAWVAVATEWGIVPGEVDTMQRAGPRCSAPGSGMLVPHELYKNPPQTGIEFSLRPGPNTLAHRLQAILKAREDVGHIPAHASGERDHFEWDQLLLPEG